MRITAPYPEGLYNRENEAAFRRMAEQALSEITRRLEDIERQIAALDARLTVEEEE